MIYVAVGIGVVIICVLLTPFWLGRGGLLQISASINSVEQLEGLKLALLKAYVKDEKAFQSGALPQRSWHQRREFLTNRYIDTTRRLDFISRTQGSAGGAR